MPLLSSNVKASLGPIPTPFSGATAWAALIPVINTINTNFNVIANGAGFIPGTVRTINSRPVSLTDGNLPLLLTDVPDAASNVYVKSTFATAGNLTSLTNRINANVTAANAAISSLRTTVNAIALSGNTGVTISYIQSNLIPYVNSLLGNVETYLTNNINSLRSYATNLVNQFEANIASTAGPIYTILDTGNTRITQLTSNVSTLFSNAAAQSLAIGTLNANLGSYQTTVNANLGTVTTNITTLFSNVGTQATTISSINSTVGTLSTQLDSLTTRVGRIDTNWTGNVASLKSNTATLASQINTVNANVSALRNDITASRTVHVENRVPTSSDGSYGDIWYQTY
jgi:hypothetical protein